MDRKLTKVGFLFGCLLAGELAGQMLNAIVGASAAPPGLPVSDNFNRANESPIGGNWTSPAMASGFAPGPINLISNAVGADIGDFNAMAYWSAIAFPDDQYAELTIASFGTGTYIGPGARINDAADDWYACITQGTVMIARRANAGMATNMDVQGATVSAGDVVRIEVATVGGDQVVTCKVNGSTVASATDSSGASELVSGSAGIIASLSDASADDWTAGAL